MNYNSTLLLAFSLSASVPSFASGLVTSQNNEHILIQANEPSDRRESRQAEALFASNSIRLSSAALSSLNPLIARAKASSDTIFELAGYSDARGSRNHILVLSIKRVNAVRDYMIDHGVRPNRIRTIAHGETRAAINIQDSGGLVFDRRVVITTIDNNGSPETPAKIGPNHSYALRAR